jgi:mRNA-decapping enzyme subunit 2
MSAPLNFSPAAVDNTAYPQPSPHANDDEEDTDDDPLVLFEDAIDEVHTRFVLNVPESELERSDRILFQIEQAWWFYEDFLVDASRRTRPRPATSKQQQQQQQQQEGQQQESEGGLGDPLLPSMTFKQFAAHIFEYSPLLDSSRFPVMWSEFTAYRKKIGTYGCILLSMDCQQVILVQLWNSKTHMFPSGKINQGEDPFDAAVRETYEETGFDVSCRQGLTAEWKEACPERITWKASAKPEDSTALSFQEDSGKRRTCYVIHGVPLDFPFGAIARKEVSKVGWHPLDNLPKHSYAVVPFVSQLRRWIGKNVAKQQTKGGGAAPNSSKGKKSSSTTPKRQRSNPRDLRSTSRGKNNNNTTPRRNRSNSRASSTTLSAKNDLVASGLAAAGDPADAAGWSEEEMFRTNERMLGRKITYDGNPHAFSEHGFMGGQDPHAFHVVGGTFLNSDGIVKLAPAPRESQLQPLFRTPSSAVERDDDKVDDQLTPFFSNDGATPWGEVVEDARASSATSSSSVAVDSATLLRSSDDSGSASAGAHGNRNRKKKGSLEARVVPIDDGGGGGAVFLTDAQITAHSQATKTSATDRPMTVLRRSEATTPATNESQSSSAAGFHERVVAQYEDDMQYIRDWVSRLRMPSAEFGGSSNGRPPFGLDAESIMAELDSIFRRGR